MSTVATALVEELEKATAAVRRVTVVAEDLGLTTTQAFSLEVERAELEHALSDLTYMLRSKL